MKFIIALLFFASSITANEPESFAFFGKHYIASFKGCSPQALNNMEGLSQAMHKAAEASGAMVLDSTSFRFWPESRPEPFFL